MKVYVIFVDEFGESRDTGVVDDKAKAEEICKELHDTYFVEYDVNDYEPFEELKRKQRTEERRLWVRETITKEFPKAQCGCFFTRSLDGDPIECVASFDGITVCICRDRARFEIFGLSFEEQRQITMYYEMLQKQQRIKD